MTSSTKYQPGTTWESWPSYDAAHQGLENYWYPVAWGNQIRNRPTGIKLCGISIMLQRGADGRVYALHDRCPHRGVRLSLGTCEFKNSNTVTCPYHGWTCVLRIAYPQFIHYEFYVPVERNRTRYVGVMVQFKSLARRFDWP